MSESLIGTGPQCVVDEHWVGSVVVVSCSGTVDLVTTPELDRRIVGVLEKEPTAIIVDMTAVDFLASAGMGLLVATHDRITPQVAFAVVADGPSTSRPMKTIGVSDIVTVHASLDAALDEFGG